MEQQLVLALSLFLVSFCTTQAWSAPEFCHGKQCPEYKLVKKTEGFEERLYNVAEWITTKVKSAESTDLLDANSRLKDYWKRLRDADNKVPDDTWPVLITIKGENEYWMSWFVPPGTTTPPDSDSSVTLESRPEATVYVRIFSGAPSIHRGQENANELCKALDENCADTTYSGAGYDSFFSLSHHNEIWIYASDTKRSKTP